MKVMARLWKINFATYIYFLIAFLCGYFKNVCLLFFIVFLHELGHLFWIKIFNYPVISIIFYPFGGLTKVNIPINASINKELLIALGGIIMQLIIEVILIIFFHSSPNLKLYLFYNETLLFFNLLPLYPLDGSKILELILEKFLPYEKALFWRDIICTIMIFLFLLLMIVQKQINWLIYLFLILQCITMFKNQKYLKNRFYLERYLYSFPYHKIESHNKIRLSLMKKDTLHFFLYQGHYLHEKAILKKYFID